MNKKELNISSRAFWDVDFEKLMLQKDNYSEFIIRKVFESGTFDDVLNIIFFYGKNKVKETMLNTHFLTEKTLHFTSSILKIDKTKFLCYTNKPVRHFYSKRSKI